MKGYEKDWDDVAYETFEIFSRLEPRMEKLNKKQEKLLTSLYNKHNSVFIRNDEIESVVNLNQYENIYDDIDRYLYSLDAEKRKESQNRWLFLFGKNLSLWYNIIEGELYENRNI